MPSLSIQDAFALALQHHQGGRLREAERIYRQILSQNPRHADALHHLGVIAHQMGRNEAAVDLIRHAIAVNPNLPEAQNNLGMTLRDLGRIDEAIAAFRQSIALLPSEPSTHNNLGITLMDGKQVMAAIAAYQAALALNPYYAEALDNLGLALRGLGQYDEAVAMIRRAIAINPQDADAHNNLSSVLKDQGELDEAIAELRRTLQLKPDLAVAHSALILIMHYHPDQGPQNIAEELGRFSDQFAAPLASSLQTHPNDPAPDRRLRIGYISPDFREHVVAQNILPLFEHHHHEEFHITCYAAAAVPDAITKQFRKHADAWRGITMLTDEQVARQIREDRIDILVDLALHTANNRLPIFARKAAPVQATFAGYPGSTGLRAIDYRLSDPYLDPSGLNPPGIDESIYTERTLRLPHTFWCYDPADYKDIPVNSLPARKTGSITFGCLNNFCKINDGVLALWAQVLRQVPGSRILLLSPEGSHRQRTLDHLKEHGVDSARVEFIARQLRRPYLELYHRIDLALDTFPYNGHTTTLEALWMGVPVVTLVGQTPVSRAGWSQLSNLDLAELAAQTPEQFAQIAVDLAGDLPRLADLRSTLRQRMQQSPLMDTEDFARNIEAAYRHMWRAWCNSKT